MPEVRPTGAALFCGHCGAPTVTQPVPGPAEARGSAPSSVHESCRQHLAMEPPRYCPECRRRMKVQVTPLGWTAECSRHGRLAS